MTITEAVVSNAELEPQNRVTEGAVIELPGHARLEEEGKKIYQMLQRCDQVPCTD